MRMTAGALRLAEAPGVDPWGARPVAWGIQMLGAEPESMLSACDPSERYEVSRFLDVQLPASEISPTEADRIIHALAARLSALEHGELGSVLDTNLELLRATLGLDAVEQSVVAFRAMLHSHPGFYVLATKYIDTCPDFVFHRKLADLFGVPPAAVTRALAAPSALLRSGLVNVEPGMLGPLTDRIQLLAGLVSPLMTPHESGRDLLEELLPPARAAHLGLSDYPHLARETRLAIAYLSSALRSREAGRNILIWGEPGTGKTELAAAFTRALKCPLYAAEGVFDNSVPLTPRERLCRLDQVQKLVRATGGGAVLIDEADDLFPMPWSNPERVPTKAALNERLERNAVPTIWVSNHTGHIDRAFLRRFDIVLHVPTLPARTRGEMLQAALPRGSLSEREIRRYSNDRTLTAAMIGRISRVAVAGGVTDPQVVRDNLRVLSTQYLHAAGAPSTPLHRSVVLAHDPSLLNTDPPISDLLQSLSKTSTFGIRMLLHGAPGTGKSALGRVLAERLGKPLIQRQASSLLSKWVGETEQNLGEMFDEVRRDDGILLIDEVDSFLRSRDRLTTGWAVTQINELFTQMEAFDGVLLCTTNRVNDLDPAALRRFDFKVAFKPLRPEQRVRLVNDCLAATGIVDAGSAWSDRAISLDGVTPGDAVAVLRRLRCQEDPVTVEMLLNALADECRYKPTAHRPIGFVQ